MPRNHNPLFSWAIDQASLPIVIMSFNFTLANGFFHRQFHARHWQKRVNNWGCTPNDVIISWFPNITQVNEHNTPPQHQTTTLKWNQMPITNKSYNELRRHEDKNGAKGSKPHISEQMLYSLSFSILLFYLLGRGYFLHVCTITKVG